jgi:hypothetical protein
LATTPVVTGLGWLLSQVTVCPVVGVSVGVHAARAGSTAQASAAVASVKPEAVERKRACKCDGAPTICRGATEAGEDPDRITDISRCGARRSAKADGISGASRCPRREPTIARAVRMSRWPAAGSLSLAVAETAQLGAQERVENWSSRPLRRSDHVARLWSSTADDTACAAHAMHCFTAARAVHLCNGPCSALGESRFTEL